MPEELLDVRNVHPRRQSLGRKGMPQEVRMHPPGQLRPLSDALYRALYSPFANAVLCIGQ